ncbi:MAG: hypothetical protein LKJ83_08075 [Eubacteriaceae bacterium]|jgi:hypothetical protein|nr:hypothetical protein [Eubacteriaceae bacterium]
MKLRKILAVIIAAAVMIAFSPALSQGAPAEAAARTLGSGYVTGTEGPTAYSADGSEDGEDLIGDDEDVTDTSDDNDEDEDVTEISAGEDGDDEEDLIDEDENNSGEDEDITDESAGDADNDAPVISVQPEDRIFAFDADSFIYPVVHIRGGGEGISYQWYMNTTGKAAPSRDKEVVTYDRGSFSTGKLDTEVEPGTYYYYCVIRNGNNDTVISRLAKMTFETFTFEEQPSTMTTTQHKTVTLSIGSVSSRLSVSWYRTADPEDTDIEDESVEKAADGAEFNVDTEEAGRYYYFACVSNSAANVVSEPAEVVVWPEAGTVFSRGSLEYEVVKGSVVRVKKGLSCGSVKAVIPRTVTYKGFSMDVLKIAPKAFRGYHRLKSVTMCNNISVGHGAFANCAKGIRFNISATFFSREKSRLRASGLPAAARFIKR